MSQDASPLAGKPAPKAILVDVARLQAAYTELSRDSRVAAQRVASGHRGTSFERSFNESHIVSITQAICDHRSIKSIDGPLFWASTHSRCPIPPSTAHWRCSPPTGCRP